MHNSSAEDVAKEDLNQIRQEICEAEKTRLIGLSSTSPDLMIFARMGVFDAFQIPDSALERRHKVTIQETAGLGAGIIIMGGIAKGWNAGDRWNGIWEQADLDRVADDRHAFVLRYTLTHPACHTNIVDTGHIDHLANNVCSAQEVGYIYQDAFRRDQIRHRNPAEGVGNL